MQQEIVLTGIAAVALAAAAGWQTLSPPPPVDYRLYYFGARDCEFCRAWKDRDLVAWRADAASKSVPMIIVEASSPNYPNCLGDFSEHAEIFTAATAGRRAWSFPLFVLVNNGRVERVASGVGGWRKITGAVRRYAGTPQRPRTA